jgi:hypothetical protein
VLYRERLQVEQELDREYASMVGGPAAGSPGHPYSRADLAIGLAGMGLIVLDIGLALGSRFRRSE